MVAICENYMDALEGNKDNQKYAKRHDRLGHPNSQVQQRIFSNSPVHNSSSNKTESACTHCIQGKMTHLPFHKSVSKACKPLEIIHSDVWGPSPITSDGGTRFYVIFVDEFTRFTWFYPIKNKSQVLSCFVSFSNTMQNIGSGLV
jgi:hypothetical protein